MKGQPCVWVVGNPERWVSELLLRTELDVRCASSWADLDDAGGRPDALIVASDRRDLPGFEQVVGRYAGVPLVLLDEFEATPVFDADDRSLIVAPEHTDAILGFLATQLAVFTEPTATRRSRVPALIWAGDESFVGRTATLSERGVTVTVPGLRSGLEDVDVALLTARACLRFRARVERVLRTEDETHLGLVWQDLDASAVGHLLDGAADGEPTLPSEPGPPRTPATGMSESSEDLPEWVQNTLSGLAHPNAWGQRVLEGRIETAMQLSGPFSPPDALLPTGDI